MGAEFHPMRHRTIRFDFFNAWNIPLVASLHPKKLPFLPFHSGSWGKGGRPAMWHPVQGVTRPFSLY